MTAGSGSGDGDRLMTVDCSARHCAEIKPLFRSSWWCGRGGSGRWLRIGVEFGMSVETDGGAGELRIAGEDCDRVQQRTIEGERDWERGGGWIWSERRR
ncbi:hypothetical protein FGB62_100g01 [Gracilaria domingensis]|nr:hypothetical protein FGB62_100g01 [Gracilaria domingensis]